MGGYDRYEYEDLDQYEDDFIEDDDPIEHEEAPKPSKEVLDYLELRQRLKEQKRKELKKENGAINGSSRDKKSLGSRDSFGSFFGPSQPVIAQRVIQESKLLLETASLSSRVNKSSQSERKSSGPTSSATKSQTSGHKPSSRNGTMPPKKLEVIKNTRDYSFLLNDDAELPVPKKVPPPRNISAPRPPEARSSQPSDRSKGAVINSGRNDFGSREDKRSTTTSGNNRLLPRVGTERSSSGVNQVRPSMDSRKLSGSSNGRLEGRPSVDPRKLSGASTGRLEGRPSVDARKHSVVPNGRLEDRPGRHNGVSNGALADRRKQLSSSNGSGPGRPVMTKAPPSRVPAGTSERKGASPASRNSVIVAGSSASKPHPPVSRLPVARKDDYFAREKPRVIPKQSVPAAKPKQLIRPPPPQPKSIARDSYRDERPKKRPMRHDEDDLDAINEIRNMFRYNPSKYNDDDDDSDMEAGFDDIMEEEHRSARIGRREDEEELRKLEEEEKKERLRKQAKKRKLTH